jgi:hypothetical protein
LVLDRKSYVKVRKQVQSRAGLVPYDADATRVKAVGVCEPPVLRDVAADDRLGLAQTHFADSTVPATALDALVAVLVDILEVGDELLLGESQGVIILREGHDPISDLVDGGGVVLVLVVLHPKVRSGFGK